MDRTWRKIEHVTNALRCGQSGGHGFDDVRFVHNCLPDVSMDEVDIKTTIGELKLSSPIVINAMTGGAQETAHINRALSIVAKECGLAMAVGSQMAAIKNTGLCSTYQIVRQENPKGLIFANLGSEATPEQALQAIEMVEADALQIHLNVVQELIMPEGDRSFRNALKRISEIVSRSPVPVFVKEVGFGMSREAIRKLAHIGVAAIDVGGTGGTNFAKIENMRRESAYDMFNDWGITTCESLLEANESTVPIIASGGIQNGLDMAKAIALGASAVGVAGRLLKYITTSGITFTVNKIKEWHEQLMIAMTALGVTTIRELQQAPVVITGRTADWASLRGINLSHYARRSAKP